MPTAKTADHMITFGQRGPAIPSATRATSTNRTKRVVVESVCTYTAKAAEKLWKERQRAAEVNI